MILSVNFPNSGQTADKLDKSIKTNKHERHYNAVRAFFLLVTRTGIEPMIPP